LENNTFRVNWFTEMEVELFLIIKDLASRSDVVVLLTEESNSELVLKYDKNTNSFSEYRIG
jgi:hypothetical protein